MASEMARPPKPTLPVNLKCPLSGALIGSKAFDEHLANAYTAKGGQSVYVLCYPHGFQGFINNPTIVELVNAEAEKAKARAVATVQRPR
jgi:hypothetical protein